MKTVSLFSQRMALSIVVLVCLLHLFIIGIYQFDLEEVSAWFPDRQLSNPVASLLFLFSFFAAVLLERGQRLAVFSARILALLIGLIGLVTLLSTLFSFYTFLDKWLFAEGLLKYGRNGQPNYMAPNTALCFFILGGALLGAGERFGSKSKISDILSLIIAVIAFISVVGYIYNANEFYQLRRYHIPMAFPTAISFCLFSLAILFLRGESGYFKLFMRPYLGSRLARYLVPTAIVIPVLVGGINLFDEVQGLYSLRLGTALYAVVIILVFLAVIIPSCIYINAVNKKLGIEINERTRLYRKLEMLNQDLGAQVDKKTKHLMDRERLFRSMIEHSVDLITVTDPEGRLRYISPSILKVLGYGPGEAMKMTAAELIHPHYLKRLNQAKKEILESPGRVKTIRLKAMHKNGSHIWLDGSIQNLVHDEFIQGIVCNFHDISLVINAKEERTRLERKLMQEELENQKRSLKAMVEGEEKQKKYIGMELHDNVNQILTSAGLYFDMALGCPELQKEMIRKGQQQLQLAVQEIRSLSKELVPYEIEGTDLKTSIEDFLRTIKSVKGIAYELHFSDRVVEKFNPDQITIIYRILQEQLNNIVKYANARSVRIELVCINETILFEIADDGNGFDPGLKRPGIGLSNISNRVALLKGEMKLITAPGEGCTLHISFPLAH